MKSGVEELSDNLGRLLEDVEALLKGAASGAGSELGEADKAARATLHRVCGHLRRPK